MQVIIDWYGGSDKIMLLKTTAKMLNNTTNVKNRRAYYKIKA